MGCRDNSRVKYTGYIQFNVKSTFKLRRLYIIVISLMFQITKDEMFADVARDILEYVSHDLSDKVWRIIHPYFIQ